MIQWQTWSEWAMQTVASAPIPTISFPCTTYLYLIVLSLALVLSLKHLEPPKIDAFQEYKYWLIFLLTRFSIFISSACSQASNAFCCTFGCHLQLCTATKNRLNCRSRHYSPLIIVCFACFYMVCSFHHGCHVVSFGRSKDTCTWHIKWLWLLWGHWWYKVYRSLKQRASCWAGAAVD